MSAATAAGRSGRSGGRQAGATAGSAKSGQSRSSGAGAGSGGSGGSKTPKKKKKKQKLAVRIIKWAVSVVLILALVVIAGGFIYLYSIIKDLPKHDPETLQRDLKLMSTIYDDAGTALQNIYLDEGQRVLATYDQLPEDLVDAIVAIEDKTFWTHKGFNVVRIVGAVKDSVTGGGEIAGTSTITQQLARNIWLVGTKSERTLDRKIKEAYYARELENNLTKEDILTAYLNTIPLGNHSYGVGAAAQSYFGKDIGQLDLIECAAIAALPQSPSVYSMIATVGIGEVAPDDPRVLLVTDQYIFLYNDAAEERIRLVLDLMLEQGYITQEEHDAAAADNIRSHLHPQPLDEASNASFFIDYLITDVASDLLEEFPGQYADIDEAIQKVYSSGLEIYSTFNQQMQDICTEEFENPENYPAAQMPRDDAGNVLNEAGQIMLYAYGNMFSDRADGEPWFWLNEGDFELRQDGSMLIKAGGRLGIYDTTNPDGSKEVAVEFRDFYTMPDDVFHITKGGIISIPSEYKGMDSEGNLILSPAFFSSDANIFTVETGEDGVERWWIGPTHFSLRQSIIQPQGATTIIEHHTGQIKAMVGGRGIEGQMQFNRATSPHSPGSTMKPIGAYGPALDMGADLEPTGSDIPTFGTYWTALSIILDEEMEYNGKNWPDNWYSGYRGPQTLRNAVQQSINVCAVKVQLAIGNQRSVNFLKKLGITTLVESGDTNDMGPASLALGGMTQGVKPLEIASAYGTFANLGVRVEPISYTKVTDRAGNVVLDGNPEKTQAMNPGAAFIMNDILHTTVTEGIATKAAVPGVPVAGKTGTNEKRNYDVWFVGNTPTYSMGVWLGCDLKVPMSQNSAASAALFSKIMARIYEGRDPGEFEPQPEGVITATVDGLTDYFVEGTVPDKLDKGTEEVDVCTESGFLATPWCPSHELRKFSTLNAQSTEGAGLAPEYYCNLHNLDTAQFPPDPAVPVNSDFGKKEVPDLIGMTITQATKALVKADLVLGTTTTQYDDAPSGEVIGQTPAAGSLMEAYSLVDIVVSKGPDPSTVVAPDPGTGNWDDQTPTPTPDPGQSGTVSLPSLIGMDLETAQDILQRYGLGFSSIEYDTSGAYPPGIIVSQNPPAGTSVSEGSQVSVVVGAS